MNLYGNDGIRPEGASCRADKNSWAVIGSLLCQRWHGQLTRLGLAAARNERPGWPLHKLWPGVQRRKVMHNDMPAC